MTRSACCAVGYGGGYRIQPSGLDPGCKDPWHISWLPHGYAPTKDDFVICLVAQPPGEDWSESSLGRGERPPLIEKVCATIEQHMAEQEPHDDDQPS